MIRAFLGLDLPAEIRSSLAVEQFLLPLPRRVDPPEFHLTLEFLGEQPEPVLDAVNEGMEALRSPSFDMALSGIGHFGGEHPRAVWAGVAPNLALEALQAKVARICRMAGVRPERRRFHPHVTLGRFTPPDAVDTMRLERAIVDRAGFRTPPFPVREVVLFRSHLGHRGAHYEPLARYPLTG